MARAGDGAGARPAERRRRVTGPGRWRAGLPPVGAPQPRGGECHTSARRSEWCPPSGGPDRASPSKPSKRDPGGPTRDRGPGTARPKPNLCRRSCTANRPSPSDRSRPDLAHARPWDPRARSSHPGGSAGARSRRLRRGGAGAARGRRCGRSASSRPERGRPCSHASPRVGCPGQGSLATGKRCPRSSPGPLLSAAPPRPPPRSIPLVAGHGAPWPRVGTFLWCARLPRGGQPARRAPGRA